MNPLDLAKAGFLLTLTNAAVAILMFSVITFVLLRIANKLSDIHFGTSYNTIATNPMALAVYLSVRYAVLGFGNAIIIAAIFMYS